MIRAEPKRRTDVTLNDDQRDDRRDEADAGSGTGDPYYMYKATMLGAPWEFALREAGMQWQIGRHGGVVPYDRIRRVRLSFRPMTMQSYRFLAEIWATEGPKLRIASTSWRNLVDHQRHDVEYVAFIRELHRRIAASGGDAQFMAGMPAPAFWLGVAVFGGMMALLVGVAAKGLLQGDWLGVAVVGGLLVLFGWQIGNFFRRNRPLRYRPDDVPDIVLPRPDGGFNLLRRSG
jgi:hypothetical protein